jgi:hypothetical protein
VAIVAELRRGASRTLAAAFLLALAAAPAAAQAFELRVAVAAAPARSAAPAWLCGEHLPKRPEWPAGMSAAAPFTLSITASGLQVGPARTELPDGALFAGSCKINEATIFVRCAHDGTEDWFVPPIVELPATWQRLLATLPQPMLDRPHTIATPILIGHLAGALADGDPRAELLRLGSSYCGELTWTAWHSGDRLRVRGRSDGGLLLPAVLATLANADEVALPPLTLQAFAARAGDRDEAARRLLQADEFADGTLQALLFADDSTALAAIDALVRRHCHAALPAIVAAAGPDMPWATRAAADAVRALWPDADAATRQRTRAALARSDSVLLRAIDLDRATARSPLPTNAAPAATEFQRRLPALAWLGCIAIGLWGLHARERQRRRTSA